MAEQQQEPQGAPQQERTSPVIPPGTQQSLTAFGPQGKGGTPQQTGGGLQFLPPPPGGGLQFSPPPQSNGVQPQQAPQPAPTQGDTTSQGVPPQAAGGGGGQPDPAAEFFNILNQILQQGQQGKGGGPPQGQPQQTPATPSPAFQLPQLPAPGTLFPLQGGGIGRIGAGQFGFGPFGGFNPISQFPVGVGLNQIPITGSGFIPGNTFSQPPSGGDPSGQGPGGAGGAGVPPAEAPQGGGPGPGGGLNQNVISGGIAGSPFGVPGRGGLIGPGFAPRRSPADFTPDTIFGGGFEGQGDKGLLQLLLGLI